MTHQNELGESGLESLGNQHTAALGARWDVARNLDLKVQMERGTLDSLDDPAAFTDIQPSAHVGDHANALSAALDFVF